MRTSTWKISRPGTCSVLLEIDTDVLYQWKDLVPTYEERITRIDGIYLKNVLCNSADAVYELKGDAKLPIRNVFIEDVHVGKVNDFIKKSAMPSMYKRGM